MTHASLTPTQARLLHLEAQGLRAPPRGRPRPQDLLTAIQRMQLLQIDTIHVVARSPYLVLYSRLGAYPQHWLDQHLEQAAIFEAWAHEACFASIADWPLLHALQRDRRRQHWALRNADRSLIEKRVAMDSLLAHIRDHGPVRAADFERSDGGGGGWWQWKDEKRWLEAWFALGELMVARRERFQRVYDLSERVLARAGRDHGAELAARPSSQALRQELILRSVRALGIADRSWIADYYRLRPAVSGDELEELVGRGQLLTVAVRGWPEPCFVHVDHQAMLSQALNGKLRASLSVPLSPFDPVVWDRQRALHLFGFDYRLECYVPASRRRHGYFVLPFLHRGRLAARLDAKMHRDRGVLELRGVWLEDGQRADEAIVAALAGAAHRFAEWHGGHQVDVAATEPGSLRRPLQHALNLMAV